MQRQAQSPITSRAARPILAIPAIRALQAQTEQELQARPARLVQPEMQGERKARQELKAVQAPLRQLPAKTPQAREPRERPETQVTPDKALPRTAARQTEQALPVKPVTAPGTRMMVAKRRTAKMPARKETKDSPKVRQAAPQQPPIRRELRRREAQQPVKPAS